MISELNIGQMFLVGFDGVTIDRDHPVVEAIVRDRVGGVILFDRNIDGSIQNIQSSGQLRVLTAALQRYAEAPLFIAVDQEGGRVCRLKASENFPTTVSAKHLGRIADIQETRRQAQRMAETLAEHGINLNLAPVVDLDLNPDNPIISRYERSFGDDVHQIVIHAAAFIEAHHGHGIACCLKHFPGHGSAGCDSHSGFVDITGSWQERELEPYRRLFQAGFADAVMSAHVVHRQLDPQGMPATLSRPMLNGVLRRRLGFPGVIISDDLQMRAITDRWGYQEAVRKAALAGVDLLIVGNNLVRQENAVEQGIRAIQDLIQSGGIEHHQIAAALQRICILKEKIAENVPW